ncbi:Uncharacterised protein [Mycobacteroides abscessus subsp. abscessus]|uniref:hypothetical protein n=1 Tax=Mycobacteroides abscessus TaxID=36809 RepID=UPI0009276838|nr:hypothetical protein [Mycobacteroides abscessus]SHS12036.1 Uncharacterised protein [Mycobacteroides abscessus subsp. abscessus]SHS12228.1 Uncharacterised protein [Mycobacteroides abscessus subsp. abscessus]SHT22514.1 Uncharacterised protein [Mycobacteroides abscessus subsp. abscessus]SHW58795.1 Uncharacterised protein [Mycobacteroides abscessus subsp. abscessus]SIB53852.1 Uncharacterised protein [Mycobacteroides abscessus subsp. abscessus]
MSAKPEQSVLDAIDALVDEQMAGGECAAIERTEAAVGALDRCALCRGAWHGSPWTGIDYEHLGEYDQHHHGRSLRCPGAFATGPQRIRYRWHDRYRWPMRYSMGRGRVADSFARLSDPMRRAYRSIANTYNALIELGIWDGAPELQPWQREMLSRWAGSNPDLPVQVPQRGADVHPEWLVDAIRGVEGL